MKHPDDPGHLREQERRAKEVFRPICNRCLDSNQFWPVSLRRQSAEPFLPETRSPADRRRWGQSDKWFVRDLVFPLRSNKRIRRLSNPFKLSQLIANSQNFYAYHLLSDST